MDTIFIIIALLILGGGVTLYKFKVSAKKPAAKPAKKAKGNIVKNDDPFYEKNPDNDPLVKLAKDAEKKASKKPRRRRKPKAKK